VYAFVSDVHSDSAMRVGSATWYTSRASGLCKMSVHIYQTTRSHKCDNLKSHQWSTLLVQVRIYVGPYWTQSCVVNFRLEHCTHTQQWSNVGIWVFHGSKHTYLHCCLHVITLCSVCLFPEDKSGRSSKTMVTADHSKSESMVQTQLSVCSCSTAHSNAALRYT
jgi:hypothetical protein